MLQLPLQDRAAFQRFARGDPFAMPADAALAASAEPMFEPLTRREREIVALLAQGFSAAEIAQNLTLAVSSVKWYVQQLYGKLGVNNKQRAVLRAAELGLLDQPGSGKTDAPAPKHSLPLQLTSFIGRQKELAEVRRLLSTARLVTLTGPGGTGKTRLALNAAGSLLHKFPNGVWVVELAALAQPELVPQMVTSTLGVTDVPGQPFIDALLDHLRAKRLLLVLDNCEHLILACAELTETLLRACPQLTVLVTSRESLAIGGEATYIVPSLSLAGSQPPSSIEVLAQFEAVQLFVERAATALPGFKLTSANALAVAHVCQQLDGIPLAIELAAARVKLLQVQQIAARLHDRFRLLTGGSRTALPRHQTLRALMDWSYDLLSEPERSLFRRLAVLVGDWTLEAAQDIGLGGGAEAAVGLDLLSQLVSKSLVSAARRPADGTRYHMLETIRQYALTQLEATAEAGAVRRRHAAYYVALAEAGGPTHFYEAPQSAWLDRMRAERDNLRAALAWILEAADGAQDAMRLASALYVSPLVVEKEGQYWMERAVAHPQAEDHPEAGAGVLLRLGSALAWQGDYAAAEAKMASGLRLVGKLADRRAKAAVLNRLGWLARERGDTTTARQWLEESAEISRDLGDTAGLASALLTLGAVAVMLEDVLWAAPLLEEALARFRELDDLEGIGWALNHLGHVAQLKGEYSRARHLQEEGLQVFGKISARFSGISEIYQSLGELDLAIGNPALASTHFQLALIQLQEQEHRSCLAWCLAGLAGAAALNGDYARAAWLWGAAESLRLSIGAREAPVSHTTHGRLMAAARQNLPSETFSAEWAAGEAAPLAAVLERALD